MRFFKCKECLSVWLPRKEETPVNCNNCNSSDIFQLGHMTAYQCKNRSENGVVLLNYTKDRGEIKLSWEEFNNGYVFIDTAQFWAKKIK